MVKRRAVAAAAAIGIASGAVADKTHGPAEFAQIEDALGEGTLRVGEEVLFTSHAGIAFSDVRPGVFAITEYRVLYASWQRKEKTYATKLSLRWDALECVAPIANMRGVVGLVFYPKGHAQAVLLLEVKTGSEREVTETVQQLIDARAPYSDDTCPALRVAGDFRHQSSGIVVPARLPGFVRHSLHRASEADAVRARFISERDHDLSDVTIEIVPRGSRTLQEEMARVVARQLESSPRFSARDAEPFPALVLGVPSTGLRVRFRGTNVLPDKVDRVIFDVGDWRVSIAARWWGRRPRRDEVLASVAESLVRVLEAEREISPPAK